MLDLDKQSLAELEALAADIRGKLGENAVPTSVATVELQDIEWEMEKRRWRHKP